MYFLALQAAVGGGGGAKCNLATFYLYNLQVDLYLGRIYACSAAPLNPRLVVHCFC